MISVYDFSEYRKYLEAWIDSQGSRAYGMRLKISEAIGVSSSLISQVLKDQKTLTPDQTADLCVFLGLSEMETDYLHLLVENDRSVNPRYRERLQKKMKSIQARAKNTGTRVPRDMELTGEQKAIYYSSWIYTAIRNLTAVEGFSTVDVISERLGLDARIVSQAVQYLLENQLCREKKGGFTYGPAATHADKNSAFANKHHQNWRLQGMQKMERKVDDDFFFTSPMSLSLEAFRQIKELLPTVIQTVMKISGPSDSETVACLNVDWFQY